MSERDEKQKGRRKSKNRPDGKRPGSVKPAPKKFQKLVIQTLVQKGKGKADEDSEEEFVLPPFVGTNLDLTKKKLKEFPPELLSRAEYIQYLYLEGNRLRKLPETFFQCLVHLKWLDLRNNELVALPTAGLKNHTSLEFLLLQGNRIKQLPTELGMLPKLRGLQISGNPIVNVPYDVISNGFQSIVGHLRRLNAQESILLPSSDAIVVRPSTIKDAETTDDNGSFNEMDKTNFLNVVRPSATDYELGDFHDSFEPLNKWNETKKLLLKSKICAKPKQRVIASSCRYLNKKRSRLGYKRKMITPQMILDKSKREFQLQKRKETLEKQARKIQRMKDREVLKKWRRHTQINAEQLKLLDNYQQYPSRNFVTDTPFDVDPEFLNMLNRTDLYRNLKELEALQKRRRKTVPKLHISIGELEKQMKEIKNKLENLNISDGNNVSPRTKQSHLCHKIAQMKDIQRTLQSLQRQNVSVTGIPQCAVNVKQSDVMLNNETALPCQ